ncbi:B-box zinc finger protein 32 [Bienertia sinuspersici]
MAEIRRNCELCDSLATVYCPSDNAFLCNSCDSKVHCANFLVARHLRSIICPNCRTTDGNQFSGTGISSSMRASCRNCSPTMEDDDESDSLSSCSSCISSTGEGGDDAETASSTKRREKVEIRKRGKGKMVMDLKVEGVLVNWCKRIGVLEDKEINQVVNMAVELMGGCLDRIAVLPFRVSLAASFWVAVRVCRRGGGVGVQLPSADSSACQDLKRVEQISGVPAKLILATEAKLARVIKRKRSREDHKEGWAEC